MKNATVKTLVLVAASSLLFGCASIQRSELDEVRAIAEKAAADAAAARETADTASARADAAANTANAAKAQSEETETKIDRMFKKAMYK